MVCLKIFDELIKASTHLSLFASNVLNVLQILLQPQHSIEIRELASGTVRIFLEN